MEVSKLNIYNPIPGNKTSDDQLFMMLSNPENIDQSDLAVSSPTRRKYQSHSNDWRNSAESFGSLRFSMSEPQYYIYQFAQPTVPAFDLNDLNGDGTTSNFELRGQLQSGGRPAAAPAITEVDPDE